jgi:ASC-1-like (ASCH) protein
MQANHSLYSNHSSGFHPGRYEPSDRSRSLYYHSSSQRRPSHQDIPRPTAHREERIPLKIQYLRLIQQGRKTVEGRVNTTMFRALQENQKVTFFSGNDEVRCTITKKRVYSSFREMLIYCGVEKCLPDITSLESAVRVYDAIPGYKDKAQQFGVVALHLATHTPSVSSQASATRSISSSSNQRAATSSSSSSAPEVTRKRTQDDEARKDKRVCTDGVKQTESRK